MSVNTPGGSTLQWDAVRVLMCLLALVLTIFVHQWLANTDHHYAGRALGRQRRSPGYCSRMRQQYRKCRVDKSTISMFRLKPGSSPSTTDRPAFYFNPFYFDSITVMLGTQETARYCFGSCGCMCLCVGPGLPRGGG